MHPSRLRKGLAAHLTLTRQVALLSLVPIVALGFVLAHVLQAQIVAQTLADANESISLVAKIGIQPRLTPRDLRAGLSAEGLRSLDAQLRARSTTRASRVTAWASATPRCTRCCSRASSRPRR